MAVVRSTSSLVRNTPGGDGTTRCGLWHNFKNHVDAFLVTGGTLLWSLLALVKRKLNKFWWWHGTVFVIFNGTPQCGLRMWCFHRLGT